MTALPSRCGPSGRTQIVSRAAWGAKAPTSVSTNVRHNGEADAGDTGHWEGGGLGDYDHSTCAAKVRGIQAFHMAPTSQGGRGWADGAYNDITCRHGVVYELRGFGVRSAAQGTTDGNLRSHAHCVLMGQGDVLTGEAKRALSDVFALYKSMGSGPNNWCHNDWHSTQCPGPDVCPFIKGGLIVASPGYTSGEFAPPLPIVSWDHCRDGAVGIGPDGSVFCEPAELYRGGPNGQPYWQGHDPARITIRVNADGSYLGYRIHAVGQAPTDLGYNYP